MTKLLTQSSAKLDKSQNDEYLNYIQYLDPNYNKDVCKGASKGCKDTCLIYSGRMKMQNAVNARKNRTEMYFNDYENYLIQLTEDIDKPYIKAVAQGKQLAIRLNGTSDLDFSFIYKKYPHVTFYEYTKRPDFINKLGPIPNLHLTFSRHEKHSIESVTHVLKRGVNVAVVFENEPPKVFKGIPVINGDKHDRRFEDEKGVIVGLKFKGTKAAKSLAIKSGFAV